MLYNDFLEALPEQPDLNLESCITHMIRTFRKAIDDKYDFEIPMSTESGTTKEGIKTTRFEFFNTLMFTVFYFDDKIEIQPFLRPEKIVIFNTESLSNLKEYLINLAKGEYFSTLLLEHLGLY